MIRFVEEGHRYFDGDREIPCYSRIVEATGVSSSFFRNIEWHATKGTYVHKAVQLLNQGKLDNSTIDDTVRPYLEAWVNFISKEEIEILDSEAILYHPELDYCGRTDMIVLWNRISPKPMILELKTGSKTQIHKLQVGAYTLAEFRDDTVRHGLLVYLKANATFQLGLIDPEEMQTWVATWKDTMAVYRENEARLW